jgi:hypothetical protein
MFQLNKKSLLAWIILSVGLASFYTYSLQENSDRSVFTPGDMTHGHYQIEMSCQECHTELMGVKQDACLKCHKEELEAINDSHPAKKFLDPRNASRLEKLDARYCITCHTEHKPGLTHKMGVTLPEDYCFHCHEDIAEERPSHTGMPFNSCATAGCHNYHDNSALYEDFLGKHLDQKAFSDNPILPARDFYKKSEQGKPLRSEDADMPSNVAITRDIERQWLETSHAKVGVNCTDCHNNKAGVWIEKPDHNSCIECHEYEVKGFLGGKHGMRLAHGLDPMSPSLARIPMKKEAMHRELSCVSCHSSHSFDTKRASVESCMDCHNDEHTNNYLKSSHYTSWLKELNGEAEPNTGVSCASCHLPRMEHKEHGDVHIRVQHNQNYTLRPNEKMVRTSCTHCHGLQFTLNSLADENAIKKNFSVSSAVHVDSLDLVKKKLEELEAKNK